MPGDCAGGTLGVFQVGSPSNPAYNTLKLIEGDPSKIAAMQTDCFDG